MKKFKFKKRVRYNKFILLILFFIVFITLFIYICTFKLNKSYSSFINFLYNGINFRKKDKSIMFNHLIGNVDYLITSYLFIDDSSNSLVSIEKPKIYIYNTHDKELYSDKKTSVLDASLMLAKNLAVYGLFSTVESKQVSNYLENRNYSDSYKISRSFLEEAVIDNQDYNYFIDIHRDSVNRNFTYIKIGDIEYARIMFVLGLENENSASNKLFMTQINDYLEKNYSGVSRGIYEKSGEGVDGVYNQDFHQNTILIEIGGVDNNYDSVFNSTKIIAEALYHIIGDNNEESN